VATLERDGVEAATRAAGRRKRDMMAAANCTNTGRVARPIDEDQGSERQQCNPADRDEVAIVWRKVAHER
jgi:hypothetical protein